MREREREHKTGFGLLGKLCVTALHQNILSILKDQENFLAIIHTLKSTFEKKLEEQTKQRNYEDSKLNKIKD